MSVIHALQVAIDLAQRKRDAQRKVLQDLQRIAQAGQAQLQQLTGYSKDTQTRWGAREGAAIKPEVFYHHYQFLDKLDNAIGLQNQTVDAQAQRVAQARQALLQAELRVQSLQKMLQRKEQEIVQQQARRDQKQTDERASLRRANPYHAA